MHPLPKKKQANPKPYIQQYFLKVLLVLIVRVELVFCSPDPSSSKPTSIIFHVQLVFVHKPWLQAFQRVFFFLSLSPSLLTIHFGEAGMKGNQLICACSIYRGFRREKSKAKERKRWGGLAEERKVLVGSWLNFLQ